MTRRRTAVVALAASGVLLSACGASLGSVDGSSSPEPERTTSSKPTVERTILDPRIDESSGLAVSGRSPGRLLTHNDSGDEAVVYAVDRSGRTAATYTFDGVTARDWEAMARVGEGSTSRLYLGDIGDNRSSWRNVAVFVAREPTGDGARTVRAKRYRLTYPDGPRDAEALMVSPTTGRIYVVSKRVAGAAIYLAPEELSTDSFNELTRWRDAPLLVTDGAFSPDGTRYALRNYTTAFVYDAASGEREASIGLPAQPQGESLTWSADGLSLLVGSEGGRQPVWRVPL